METLHKSIHEAVNVMTSLLLNLELAENQQDKRIIQAIKDSKRMVIILHNMSKHID